MLTAQALTPYSQYDLVILAQGATIAGALHFTSLSISNVLQRHVYHFRLAIQRLKLSLSKP